MSSEKFTFVDLFAGIGGFHAALEQMGGRCLLAVEKDEQAARVYQDNWGLDPRGDVTDPEWLNSLTPETELDVLCAGFPCQPFSKSGAQLGMSEARGTLFFNICEAIERWKPAVVFLENVRNLAGPRHTHEWEVIVASLRELGYAVDDQPLIVSPHWLAPEDGGRPQSRERVYILATRVDGAVRTLGKTVHLDLDTRRSWDLEEHLPVQSIEEVAGQDLEVSPDEEQWIEAWTAFAGALRLAGVEVPRFPVWVDSWHENAVRVSTRAGDPAWKAKIIARNQQFWEDNLELLEGWAKLVGVRSFPASRRKFEWQAQDADPLLDNLLYQMRPSGLRVKKATHTGALVAIDQRPVLDWQGRRLSIRECARLQGFPEDFTFDAVPARAAYKQLGNAVCVSVVRAVLEAHLRDARVRAALGDRSRLLGAQRA